MYIYSIFLILPLLFYFSGIKNQDKTRTKMEKMMLTMGASMLVGLTFGLFIGAIYHGAYFNSFIISLIVTTIVGFLIGLPHGKITVIEGVFSGGMAGIMGAMTAEMLSVPEIRTIMLLLILLMSLGGFWCMHFWKNGFLYNKTYKVFIFHIATILYLLFITYLFIMYPPFQQGNEAPHVHTSLLNN
ncbi:hypothetical protein QA612_10775 [Evansella sp. AB-P1]|uniref:hypothetical protein n=1 Tax=Evansella sp. AB-P1 TaxID=3037653 RepID=UPI00241E3790|nr:hypothetical protein [Evansella sp. AB-P1]MDG5787972.1 hypothetical protein [Evansella sp. AB-P1]